jgi:hypothetical protein
MASDKQEGDLRVPGARWRVLAHADGRLIELENQGVVDEVVIDDWLHLEHMSDGQWWMRVGDARVWVNIEPDGKVRVDVERGCYEDAHGASKDG